MDGRRVAEGFQLFPHHGVLVAGVELDGPVQVGAVPQHGVRAADIRPVGHPAKHYRQFAEHLPDLGQTGQMKQLRCPELQGRPVEGDEVHGALGGLRRRERPHVEGLRTKAQSLRSLRQPAPLELHRRQHQVRNQDCFEQLILGFEHPLLSPGTNMPLHGIEPPGHRLPRRPIEAGTLLFTLK